MKLDDAISSHLSWKIKLHQFLDGQGEKLDSRNVQRDDVCALGQWLHGVGKAHANRAEFTNLLKEHAQFHRTAADVVRAIELGGRDRAKALLAPAGQFEQASESTVSAIVRLKRVVK